MFFVNKRKLEDRLNIQTVAHEQRYLPNDMAFYYELKYGNDRWLKQMRKKYVSDNIQSYEVRNDY